MSSVDPSVQEYIARQPQIDKRRAIMRPIIRWLGMSVLWDVTVEGLENIPDSGRTLLIMNHSTLLDPGLCMMAVTKRFVVPMTKEENMNVPILSQIIRFWGSYSVKRGAVDRKALQNSIEMIKSGQLILLAPEGTRHPEGLAEPKDGIAYIAAKADPVIVPVGISGGVGWKDSLKRLKKHKVHMRFGRPFRFNVDGESRISRELRAKMSREAMYQIALTLPDPSMRGIYSDVENATTETITFVDPQHAEAAPVSA